MDVPALFPLMGAAAINSAMPGPCMVLIVSQAATGGIRSGLMVSLGVAAAQMTYFFTALLSLSLTWGISESVHAAIRYGGAGILLVLALRMLAPALRTDDPGGKPAVRPGSDLLSGLCVGLSSPFNLVFMFAILPIYVPPGALHDPAIPVVATALLAATAGPMIVTAWLGTGTRRIGHSAAPIVRRLGGLAMVVFAGLSLASGT